MPSFDAAGIVEPLHLRLMPYANFDEDVKEPSDRQIGEFVRGLKQLMSGALETMGVTVAGDASPAEQMAALDDLEPDKFVEVMTGMAGLHSTLCSGHPTPRQILQVPLRIRMLMFAWLQTEVMSPEAVPAAGNVSALTRQRAAAG